MSQEKDQEFLDSELESKLVVGGRSKDRAHSTEGGNEEPITEINVAPLVDVALVLVIIFMAVSPFVLQAGLDVQHSSGGKTSTGKAAIDQNIEIVLSRDGQIKVDDKVVTAEQLPAQLKELLPMSKDRLVSVLADNENYVGQVVEVLDIAKQSGAAKVAIVNKAK